MKNEIILMLAIPPSANRMWATRVVTPKGKRPMAVTYVTQEAKLYKDEVARIARKAGVHEPIRGRVQLDILLYPHRPLDWKKRQRQHGAAWDDTVQVLDLDNVSKCLLDALKDVVMEDDRWVRKIVAQRMEPDEHGARVVVRVMALPVEQPQLELAGGAA